jgi:ABC-type multidrug transport system ATPase subunit
VAELSKVRDNVRAGPRQKPKHTLYVLDEPTVGLHMADVEKLIHVLHRLVDAGNTAVVVEHNLDVMAEADWILDMGPEAGEGGGKVVAQGPPAQIVKRKKESHTGRVLETFLKGRTSAPAPKAAARLAGSAASMQAEASTVDANEALATTTVKRRGRSAGTAAKRGSPAVARVAAATDATTRKRSGSLSDRTTSARWASAKRKG